MNKTLQKYKFHYNYAKQYGDTDIQVAYFAKITDLFAQELYSEFGFDTCDSGTQDCILKSLQ